MPPNPMLPPLGGRAGLAPLLEEGGLTGGAGPNVPETLDALLVFNPPFPLLPFALCALRAINCCRLKSSFWVSNFFTVPCNRFIWFFVYESSFFTASNSFLCSTAALAF